MEQVIQQDYGMNQYLVGNFNFFPEQETQCHVFAAVHLKRRKEIYLVHTDLSAVRRNQILCPCAPFFITDHIQ